MRSLRKHSPGIKFSKRELKQLLFMLLVMILAVLYGLYLGLWSLHKEEEENSPATYSRNPQSANQAILVDRSSPTTGSS